MKILSLDLATQTGVAYGEAGTAPRDVYTCLWDLRRWPTAAGSLAMHFRFFVKKFGVPDIVIAEATINPAGQKHATTIVSQERLHGAAEACAVLWAVKDYRAVAPARIRKHFIGVPNMGDREETKRAVKKQAAMLGYLFIDDNEADACAGWDWASSTICRRPPGQLKLFGT